MKRESDMLGQKSVWLSFDVEATGPCPGIHAMLSVGVAAFTRDSDGEFRDLGEFSANLLVPEGLKWDIDTSKWWDQHEDAFAIARHDMLAPEIAMPQFCHWLSEVQAVQPEWKPLVWAAYPAAFDMPFVNYYMHRYAPKEWLEVAKDDVMQRVSCFDMGSFASLLLNVDPLEVSKSRMPAAWIGKNLRPHVALDDAREQAHMLKAMLQAASDLSR